MVLFQVLTVKRSLRQQAGWGGGQGCCFVFCLGVLTSNVRSNQQAGWGGGLSCFVVLFRGLNCQTFRTSQQAGWGRRSGCCFVVLFGVFNCQTFAPASKLVGAVVWLFVRGFVGRLTVNVASASKLAGRRIGRWNSYAGALEGSYSDTLVAWYVGMLELIAPVGLSDWSEVCQVRAKSHHSQPALPRPPVGLSDWSQSLEVRTTIPHAPHPPRTPSPNAPNTTRSHRPHLTDYRYGSQVLLQLGHGTLPELLHGVLGAIHVRSDLGKDICCKLCI